MEVGFGREVAVIEETINDDDSSFEDERTPLSPRGGRGSILGWSPPTPRKTSCSPENLKKFFIFSGLWMAYLIISAAYSIISPFYPQEAQRYGVGSLEVGLIVGASPLCVVILSPIFGYFIPEIGLKFMLISGCFVVGGAFVLLGYLIKMSTRLQFVLFSVVLRVVEGIGSAGYSTSLFTMATVLYPESTGTVIGILELGSGIGFVFGPPLGGLLYNVGGFLLPFVVTGGLVLLFVPFFLLCLPSTPGKKQFIPIKTLCKLHTNVPFLVLGLDNIIAIAALGFFTPTLAPFLESQFKLSELGVGLVFLCGPLFYMIFSFVSGKLSDIWGPRYFIIIGFFITGVSYFFLGPAQFISTESHLWLTCVALSVTGIGLGLGIVPIYPDMLQIAKRVDPATDYETMSGVVSGLSSSTLCLGEFIGPIIGGALTQVLSFQDSAMIFGEVLIAKGMLLLGITLVDRFIRRRSASPRTSEPVN